MYSSDYYLTRYDYYFRNVVVDPVQGTLDGNIRSLTAAMDRIAEMKPDRGRLLDVGCGLGVFPQIARSQGWDVCGIDASPYATRYARERFGIDVRTRSRLKGVSFPAGYFDVITLWDALEHFPNPVEQLVEICNLLDDGGILMLDTPNGTAWLRTTAEALYRLTGGKLKYPLTKLYHKYHLFYYTPKALTVLLERAGFRLISLDFKPIPLVKARGSRVDKLLVKMVSCLTRNSSNEYELLALARKNNGVERAPE